MLRKQITFTTLTRLVSAVLVIGMEGNRNFSSLLPVFQANRLYRFLPAKPLTWFGQMKGPRRCLFPFRKQAMSFLTVDAIIGNQAFQDGRCYICSSLGLDKVKTDLHLPNA